MYRAEYPADQDDYVQATYRYLRLSLVVLVITLFVSLAMEIRGEAGWLGSISAYYYTPVHSVFVGMLITIGVSLIAIKGRNTAEDTFLNIAGSLAFIVALVPTGPPKICHGTDSESFGCIPEPIEIRVTGTTDLFRNNIPALLIGLAVALVLVWLFTKLSGVVDEPGVAMSTIVSSGVIVAFLVIGFVWYLGSEESFEAHAHVPAAILMFGFVGLAVLTNTALLPSGISQRIGAPPATLPPESYQRFYKLALTLMVLTLLGALILSWRDVRTTVLWLEVGEIACLAFYWAVQTAEGWSRGPTGGMG